MDTVRPQPVARFNVLLTQDRPRGDEAWFTQLPKLLQPQGVQAFMARSAREALRIAEQQTIHAAVIDLGVPVASETDLDDPTGAAHRLPHGSGFARTELWLLELFRRLPRRPPIVVLRQPAGDRQAAQRMLGEALRLGAFTVMDKPVNVERVLATFQRLLERQYRGQWPTPPRFG